MTAHQAVHRVATMCRVLGVSPSGYYAWRKRPLSTRARTDVELTAHIDAIHRVSRGTDGASGLVTSLARPGGNVTGCRTSARIWWASVWNCSSRLFRGSVGSLPSGIQVPAASAWRETC